MNTTSNTRLISGLLHSTALTRQALMVSIAAGVLFLSHPALAVDDLELPTGGTVVGGSATFNYSAPGQLGVNQGTDRLVVDWNSFNIGAHATTTFVQPNSGSLAVNRVTGPGNDPTQILGTLKANGRVMVLDQNGVIFGANSRVDAAGIIASTGNISNAAVMSGSNQLQLSNFGNGAVENHGDISVADGGLAALVAPTVRNSGTITARLGRVALAAGGDAVTVDLYGDNLIEMALDSTASKAVIEQTGTINAEGGLVQISARAAKGVVDNVINMSGVINASSVSQQGGRIVLSGDTVNVTGDMNVSGTKGGSVSVTARRANIASTARVRANSTTGSTAGTIKILADEQTTVNGTLEAKGQAGTGFIETSAHTVGFGSTASILTTGEWLIDPTDITIDAGLEALLEAQLALGNASVTTSAAGPDAGNIYVQQTIDWSTANLLTLTAINDILFTTATAGINASGSGSVLFNAGRNISLANGSGVVSNGGNLSFNSVRFRLNSGTVNANGGNITFANSGGFQALANSIKTSGTGTITLNQNKDADAFFSINTIQNAINAISNTGTGTSTINVGAGTYAENLTVDRALTLKGANSGIAAYGVRGPETIITPTTVGFNVTSNNVAVDGFSIRGGVNAIKSNGVNNLTVSNNIIRSATGNSIQSVATTNSTYSNNGIFEGGAIGISLTGGSNNANVSGNALGRVHGTGIYVEASDASRIIGNFIGYTNAGITSAGANNIYGDGILIKSVTNAGGTQTVIQGNKITNTASPANFYGSGIHIRYGDHVVIGGAGVGQANIITNTAWDGIRGLTSADLSILNNQVSTVTRDGIYVTGSNGLTIGNNNVNGTAQFHGIEVYDSTNASVLANTIANAHLAGINLYNLSGLTTASGNIINNTGSSGIQSDVTSNLQITNNLIGTLTGNINGDGILVLNSTNAGGTTTSISGNTISNTLSPTTFYGNGIHVRFSDHVLADNNTISNTAWDGMRFYGGSDAHIGTNGITNVNRDGIYATGLSVVTVEGNIINGTTTNHGIEIDNSTTSTVNSNTISNTKLAGINLTNLKGLTGVSSNTINNTGSSGIQSDKTSNLLINGNLIGTLTGNINGDGILVLNSTNAGGTRTTIQGNTITGLISPKNNYGNGIHVRYSDHVDVVSNTIFNTAWDGIRLFVGSDQTVTANNIDDVLRDGVYATGINGLTLTGNDVDGTTQYHGLEIYDSNNVSVLANTVANTHLSGVRLHNLDGTTLVDGNTINNIGTNGIETSAVDDLTLTSNNVTTAGGSGVFVHGEAPGLVTVTGNNVTDADVGMTFEGGTIDLTGGANVLNGGSVGYRFAPIAVPGGFSVLSLVGDTIGTTTFNGQSTYYVELINGALFAPGSPTIIDGSNSIYDGLNPALSGGFVSLADAATLESKIQHFNDDPTLGLFFFGTAVDLQQNRIFNDNIDFFVPDTGAAGFTITGMPSVPGNNPAPGAPETTNPADLNNLAPAAGGDQQAQDGDQTPEQLAALEPAAGGQNTSCWSDAVNLASSGQTASYNFSNDPLAAMNDASSCGSPNN